MGPCGGRRSKQHDDDGSPTMPRRKGTKLGTAVDEATRAVIKSLRKTAKQQRDRIFFSSLNVYRVSLLEDLYNKKPCLEPIEMSFVSRNMSFSVVDMDFVSPLATPYILNHAHRRSVSAGVIGRPSCDRAAPGCHQDPDMRPSESRRVRGVPSGRARGSRTRHGRRRKDQKRTFLRTLSRKLRPVRSSTFPAWSKSRTIAALVCSNSLQTRQDSQLVTEQHEGCR